ncbi:MAG: YxeA family protein [Adlercreutzia sp.]|nr:YxeA family protein [Adlercreutzia sp.]
MSKGKALGLAAVFAVIILGAGFFCLGFSTNLLASGTYYTKIDNAHVTENDSTGDVIHLKSSEPFVYQLHAANEDGHEIEASFGAAHELRQDAYLELKLEPLRGVVYWEEVSPEDLPSKAADILD